MIYVDSKKYDKDEIIKLFPREKVSYNCASCGNEQIKNSGSLRSKLNGPLLCTGCNVSKSKLEGKKKVLDGQLITNFDEIVNISISSRKSKVKFVCTRCNSFVEESAGPLEYREKLVCSKCSRELRSLLRFGVKNSLSINYKKGLDATHTFLGTYSTRLGLIRNLWEINIQERIDQLKQHDWILIDTNKAYGTILIQSTCCNVYRLIKMGTCKVQNIKCDCQKHGFSSKEEEKFFQSLKNEFGKYTLIHGLRNWNKFRENNLKGNYEIDIFIKELNLGIEFNGVRWHDKTNQKRELNKIRIAKENGISLINIWEDDWKKDHQNCINYIRYKIEEINGRHNLS